MTDEAQDKLQSYMARPRAEDVANVTAAAESQARGFRCPKCHCNNFRVVYGTWGDEEKTRRRECRCCGYRFTTVEVPVS